MAPPTLFSVCLGNRALLLNVERQSLAQNDANPFPHIQTEVPEYDLQYTGTVFQ